MSDYDYYTGRWLIHDPLGITPNAPKPNRFDATEQYGDGMNLYEYVRSNPVVLLDSLGLEVGPVCCKINYETAFCGPFGCTAVSECTQETIPNRYNCTLKGLLELAENFVSFIVAQLLQNNKDQLEILGVDLTALEKTKPPFYRLSYTEAVEILTGQKTKDFLAKELKELQDLKEQTENKISELEEKQKGPLKQWQKDKIAAELIELRISLAETNTKIENNPKHAGLAAEFQWGKDLGGSDETIISQMHDKPVFITHYPREAKAFYMKTDRDNQDVVLNFDLLAPAGFGEIIGGSVREDDYDLLVKRINEQGLNPENYKWYLDLRKYGSVPHGGFGLGIERTVAWLTGERHIRQCIAFPRLMEKVYI